MLTVAGADDPVSCLRDCSIVVRSGGFGRRGRPACTAAAAGDDDEDDDDDEDEDEDEDGAEEEEEAVADAGVDDDEG